MRAPTAGRRSVTLPRALVCLCALVLGGCAKLLGIEYMSFDGLDSGMANGQVDGEFDLDAEKENDALGGGLEASVASDGAANHDSSGGPPPLKPGFLECAGTTTSCDVASGAYCCVSATGTTTQDDAGVAWVGATATCDDEVDGALSAECGGTAVLGGGSMTMLTSFFLQGCAQKSDCLSSQYCCATLGDAGAAGMGIAVVSDLECAAAPCSGLVVCRTASDCPGGNTCMPESDPVLSHLWSGTCL
jgi:hypothetical protein